MGGGGGSFSPGCSANASNRISKRGSAERLIASTVVNVDEVMSAIASFYLVSRHDVPTLKKLAVEPAGLIWQTRWFWIFPYFALGSHDPYWEFLFSKARELEQYSWSGYVIGLTLFHFFEDRSISPEHFVDEELSAFFSKTREGSVFIFQKEGALRFREAIERNNPDEQSITAFLEKMKSPILEGYPIQSVLDGAEILKRWLSQVDGQSVGLLKIG
jgi:hypothetical protein